MASSGTDVGGRKAELLNSVCHLILQVPVLLLEVQSCEGEEILSFQIVLCTLESYGGTQRGC